jgi:hypothetical protein
LQHLAQVLLTQEAEKHYDSASILLMTELAKQRPQGGLSRRPHAACVALSAGPAQWLMEPKHTQPQCLAVPLA